MHATVSGLWWFVSSTLPLSCRHTKYRCTDNHDLLGLLKTQSFSRLGCLPEDEEVGEASSEVLSAALLNRSFHRFPPLVGRMRAVTF